MKINPLKLLPRRIPYRTIFWGIFFLVVLGGAAALGGLMGYIEAQPPVEELVDYRPKQSTFVYDHQKKLVLAEFSAERRYLLRYDEIPRQLINAFLAIEDKRFYEHCGIDPIGIARAFIKNFQYGSRREGASTITQQLARNVVKDIGSQRTYTRKINEALTALRIEQRYTKEEIIAYYLNQIPFGGVNYGVEAAARTYFRKSVGELSLAECAMLAGIPKAPSMLNPSVNPEKSLERRNLVLRQMERGGYISKAECELAQKESLPDRAMMRSSNALYRAPYFIDYMEESLYDTDQFLEMAKRVKKDPTEYIKTEGLQVISTLDPVLQRIAEESVRKGLEQAEADWHANKPKRRDAESDEEYSAPKPGQERIGEIVALDDNTITVEVVGYKGELDRPAVPPFYNWQSILKKGELLDVRVDDVDRDSRTFTGIMLPESKIKSGMVVIEAQTGRVLALVGGDNYYDKNEKKAEWNFATQGGRQPGSGIKPLFYAAAVHSKFSPDRTFLNVPFYIGDYIGRNYSPTYEGQMMTMQEGLERSQNVMMLRVFQALGFKRGLDFVQRFDFAWRSPQWQDIETGGAAVCLGTFDVTPLELAAAYTVFPNEGIGIRPYAVERILNRKGEVIYTAMPEKRPVLTPQEAYIMTSMLRGVFGPRGTARDLGEHFAELEDAPQMAGKTGTTSEVRDAWFNGFTPDLVISVFVGFDPPRPLGGKMTGSTLAGPIWQDFMDQALALEDREWTREFKVPEGLEKKVVNLSTGLPVPEWRQDEDSENLAEMYFISGEEN